MSYEIASEFFQLVIQKRRDQGDLATPILQRQVPVRRLWDEREPELLFDTRGWGATPGDARARSVSEWTRTQ